jgi:hypothetical protein
MSNVSTTIHANKEGIIAYLEEKRTYHKECSQPLPDQTGKETRTQKLRNFHRGVAEGLWLAIETIKDWAEADDIVVKEEKENTTSNG